MLHKNVMYDRKLSAWMHTCTWNSPVWIKAEKLICSLVARSFDLGKGPLDLGKLSNKKPALAPIIDWGNNELQTNWCVARRTAKDTHYQFLWPLKHFASLWVDLNEKVKPDLRGHSYREFDLVFTCKRHWVNKYYNKYTLSYATSLSPFSHLLSKMLFLKHPGKRLCLI